MNDQEFEKFPVFFLVLGPLFLSKHILTAKGHTRDLLAAMIAHQATINMVLNLIPASGCLTETEIRQVLQLSCHGCVDLTDDQMDG